MSTPPRMYEVFLLVFFLSCWAIVALAIFSPEYRADITPPWNR